MPMAHLLRGSALSRLLSAQAPRQRSSCLLPLRPSEPQARLLRFPDRRGWLGRRPESLPSSASQAELLLLSQARRAGDSPPPSPVGITAAAAKATNRDRRCRCWIEVAGEVPIANSH